MSETVTVNAPCYRVMRALPRQLELEKSVWRAATPRFSSLSPFGHGRVGVL
jgi:hypothetical protein